MLSSAYLAVAHASLAHPHSSTAAAENGHFWLHVLTFGFVVVALLLAAGALSVALNRNKRRRKKTG